MKPFLVTCLLFITLGCFAQRTTHNLFWGRLALADTINSKLKLELYLQKRTQNNGSGDHNIFNSNQFLSYWFWVNYAATKNITVSVSPFGYFESYILNNSSLDAEKLPIKEYRFCARVEHMNRGKYLNFANRYSFEFRNRDLLNDGDYKQNLRVRYMARLEKPVRGILPKPLTFTISDEIFLQFGGAVKNNPNIFDQNRLYGGAAYEVMKNVKLTVGYIYGYQERNSGEEFDHINYLWVILTLDNLVTQFLPKR